jgi:DNA-binding NarL/FixJ family response regulator
MKKINLTDRDIEIIGLICMNKTINEIAKELFISMRTFEGRRLHIRKKNGLQKPGRSGQFCYSERFDEVIGLVFRFDPLEKAKSINGKI